MTSTTYGLPVKESEDQDGKPVPFAYVPGAGAVPLRGGTVNAVIDGAFGAVHLTQHLTEQGGAAYAACAAATAVSVKASAGRLCKVIVLATGTAAVSIYDNTSATGTVVFIVPANTAAGTIYALDVPCANGIFVGGTTSTPQMLITYY